MVVDCRFPLFPRCPTGAATDDAHDACSAAGGERDWR